MRPRPFDPAEPGTPEVVWPADGRWDDAPTVDPSSLGAARLVVLAAHPDDETLGVGALLADLAEAGVDIDVVVATDGAASHPESQLWSPGRLAAVRRAELDHAVGILAPRAHVHHLGLPDGGLGRDPELLRTRLAEVLGAASEREVLIAPYEHDGHVDHDTLGAVARDLAAERGSTSWFYPIWAWHWAVPDELPWDSIVTVDVSPRALHLKAAAIEEHRSQVGPISPLPGDEVLLPPHVVRRFRRVVETLIAGPGTPVPDRSTAEEQRRTARRDGFERMLDQGDDPWRATTPYERRKHALTCAVFTRDRYSEVVEVGCSTGALTARLAELADHVTAIDTSARALEVARRRGLSGVTWVEAQVPGGLADVPDASVDLVLVSEVAYFLTGSELLSLLRHTRRVLADDGEIVFVDWRAGSEQLPLDGELVHDQVDSALADLGRRVDYTDDSARIGVWGGRPIRPDVTR